MKANRTVCLVFLLTFELIAAGHTAAQSTCYMSVHTSSGTDTIVAGVLSSLRFTIDSTEAEEIARFDWPIKFTFSSANLIGPLQDTGLASNVGYVAWTDGPDSMTLSGSSTVSSPDTVLVQLVDTVPPGWAAAGEQWRISFIPADTGQILIDSCTAASGHSLSAVASDGTLLPIAWQPRTITVAPFCPSGDLDGDGEVDGADLYILVRYAIQSCPPPSVCLAHADVSCDGDISSADIILEIHYIYHGDKPIGYTCSPGMQAMWGCQ